MNSKGAPGACSRAGATKRASVRLQRGALEVDVAGLALERRAGEDAPREPAVARPGGELGRRGGSSVAGADQCSRGARRAGRSARGRVLADRVEAAQRGDEDRQIEELARAGRGTCPRGRERARAVDDDVLERDAPRARRRGLVAADDDDVALGVQRPAARGHLDHAATRRREVDAGPASAAIRRSMRRRIGMAQAEQALRERVVAAVEVAEHDEEVAARDRVGARRGDLQVGRVVVGAVPRRRPVGERACRRRRPTPSGAAARAARRPSGPTARSPRPSAGRAAARAGPRGRARSRSSSSAPRSNTRPHHQRDAASTERQRRAQLVDHGRAERQIEVAHAVQVGDRPPAAAVAVGARGGPAGRPPRRRGRAASSAAATRSRGAAATASRAASSRSSADVSAQERAQRALGERAHRQRRVDAGRGARPPSPTSRSARRARVRARPSGPRSPRRPPRTSPRPAARRTRSCRSSSSSAASSPATTSAQRRWRDGLPGAPAASLSTARASDSRLCHATASRNAGSRATSRSRSLLAGPEDVQPLHREARAAHGELRPQAPTRVVSCRYSLECHLSQCERPVKRKYDAPGRREAAAQTRERICAAAEVLFLARRLRAHEHPRRGEGGGGVRGDRLPRVPEQARAADAVILRAVRDNPSEPLDAIAAAPPAEILPRLAAPTPR